MQSVEKEIRMYFYVRDGPEIPKWGLQNSIFRNGKRINYRERINSHKRTDIVIYGGRTTISNPIIVLTLEKDNTAFLESINSRRYRRVNRFDLLQDMILFAIYTSKQRGYTYLNVCDNFSLFFSKDHHVIHFGISDLYYMSYGKTFIETVIPSISTQRTTTWDTNASWDSLIKEKYDIITHSAYNKEPGSATKIIKYILTDKCLLEQFIFLAHSLKIKTCMNTFYRENYEINLHII